MIDEILEHIPRESGDEEIAENRRIHEIADELRRRCQLYETQSRSCEENVSRTEIEQRVAEQYAKSICIWTPYNDIDHLGLPGPSGNENDLYASNNIVFKVNNLLNCNGSILRFLDKLCWHNNLFYDTAYTFYGFSGFDGRSIMPIVKQQLIKNARPATQIEIDTYMAAIGFVNKGIQGRFENDQYEVWDLLPRNVLKDADGDIYIVDAEICRRK